MLYDGKVDQTKAAIKTDKIILKYSVTSRHMAFIQRLINVDVSSSHLYNALTSTQRHDILYKTSTSIQGCDITLMLM